MSEDFLLTAVELVAKMRPLIINLDTVRRLTRAGKIPHHKVGVDTRYRLSEVLAATQNGSDLIAN